MVWLASEHRTSYFSDAASVCCIVHPRVKMCVPATGIDMLIICKRLIEDQPHIPTTRTHVKTVKVRVCSVPWSSEALSKDIQRVVTSPENGGTVYAACF